MFLLSEYTSPPTLIWSLLFAFSSHILFPFFLLVFFNHWLSQPDEEIDVYDKDWNRCFGREHLNSYVEKYLDIFLALLNKPNQFIEGNSILLPLYVLVFFTFFPHLRSECYFIFNHFCFSIRLFLLLILLFGWSVNLFVVFSFVLFIHAFFFC